MRILFIFIIRKKDQESAHVEATQSVGEFSVTRGATDRISICVDESIATYLCSAAFREIYVIFMLDIFSQNSNAILFFMFCFFFRSITQVLNLFSMSSFHSCHAQYNQPFRALQKPISPFNLQYLYFFLVHLRLSFCLWV